ASLESACEQRNPRRPLIRARAGAGVGAQLLGSGSTERLRRLEITLTPGEPRTIGLNEAAVAVRVLEVVDFGVECAHGIGLAESALCDRDVEEAADLGQRVARRLRIVTSQTEVVRRLLELVAPNEA